MPAIDPYAEAVWAIPDPYADAVCTRCHLPVYRMAAGTLNLYYREHGGDTTRCWPDPAREDFLESHTVEEIGTTTTAPQTAHEIAANILAAFPRFGGMDEFLTDPGGIVAYHELAPGADDGVVAEAIYLVVREEAALDPRATVLVEDYTGEAVVGPDL